MLFVNHEYIIMKIKKSYMIFLLKHLIYLHFNNILLNKT